MKQYFVENPSLPNTPRILSLDFDNMSFTFSTHAGLFSPKKIDTASLLLLTHMPPLSGSLLDMGCGYGLIGIVLGKKNSVTLTLCDVNRLALACAVKNAAQNKVTATAIHSDGFAEITDTFDHIVMNPPIHAGKAVMYRLYTDAHSHLNKDGSLYIVIQTKHGAPSTQTMLTDLFESCEVLYKKKGYHIFKCSRK